MVTDLVVAVPSFWTMVGNCGGGDGCLTSKCGMVSSHIDDDDGGGGSESSSVAGPGIVGHARAYGLVNPSPDGG